jgi:tetratricopeptide (TPR) repeat protein
MSGRAAELWLLRMCANDDDESNEIATVPAHIVEALDEAQRALLAQLARGAVREALESALVGAVRGNIGAAIASESDALSRVLVAATLCWAFAQQHWTGPPVVEAAAEIADEKQKEELVKLLQVDGELLARSVADHVASMTWLRDANAILKDKSLLRRAHSAPWWRARAIWLHQRALRGASATLRDALDAQFAVAHERFGLFEHVAVERLISITFRVVRDESEVAAAATTTPFDDPLFGDALASAIDDSDDDANDNDNGRATTSVRDEFDADMAELVAQLEASQLGDESDDVSNRWRSADTAVNGLETRAHRTLEQRDLAARLYVERAHALGYYQHDTRTALALSMARRATGLTLQMSGAQGRRTKFQTFDIAQLVLFARMRDAPGATTAAAVAAAAAAAPQAIPLNDDVRLDKINFTETVERTPLRALERAIVIAFGRAATRRGARFDDGLSAEEERAYVDCAMAMPAGANADWTVYSAALLARASLDVQQHRTAERGALQIQSLVDQYALTSNESEAARDAADAARTALLRLRNVFVAGVPPLHALKLALGDAMVRIGAARTAQNVFEELAEHARVLACMRVAGDASRAEEFCLELLAKTPTPELWSVLGELRGVKRGGVECFERAWQLSNGRYAPAKRALGRIAVAEQRWRDAILHFSLALAVNRIDVASWFSRGVAHMRLEQFDAAAQAFQEAVRQRPEDGESWANLAASLHHTGRVRSAFRAMRQAVREKARSWRMWQNLQTMAMDSAEYQAAIHASLKIVELDAEGVGPRHEAGAKHVAPLDAGMLATLVVVAMRDYKAAADATTRVPLLTAVVGLLRAATARIADSDDQWTVFAELYRDLAASTRSTDAAVRRAYSSRCVDARFRALRSVESGASDFDTDTKAFTRVARRAMQLFDAFDEHARLTADTAAAAAAAAHDAAVTVADNELAVTAVDLPPVSSAAMSVRTILKRAADKMAGEDLYKVLAEKVGRN